MRQSLRRTPVPTQLLSCHLRDCQFDAGLTAECRFHASINSFHGRRSCRPASQRINAEGDLEVKAHPPSFPLKQSSSQRGSKPLNRLNGLTSSCVDDRRDHASMDAHDRPHTRRCLSRDHQPNGEISRMWIWELWSID